MELRGKVRIITAPAQSDNGVFANCKGLFNTFVGQGQQVATGIHLSARDSTAMALAQVPNKAVIEITAGYWFQDSFTGNDGKTRYVIKGRIAEFRVVSLPKEAEAAETGTEAAAETQAA